MSVPFGFVESTSGEHPISDDTIICFVGFAFMVICVALIARYDNADDDW